MARGVNKVILIGNLGNDPEQRAMPNGSAVTRITVATTESWKDKQTGQQQERTEWHRIVFFNRLAEIAGQYLKKGSKVYLEGSLRTQKWEKNGEDRYTTEIVATELQMLDSRQDNSKSQGYQQPAQQTAQQPARQQSQQSAQQGYASGGPGNSVAQQPNFDDFDDDIPF